MVVRLQSTPIMSISVQEPVPLHFAGALAGVIMDFSVIETAEKDSFLHVSGVIASFDPGSWTSSEDPIKRFKVVDGYGRAIPCVALGEIANDQSLGHGRHVTLFYLRTQPGLKSGEPGACWLYQDRRVLCVGLKDLVAKVVLVGC